ncbi:5-methyltetrahydropteroyltriglutamate--homocysteine S-methyltransferase [Salmonella enterica subsp. enterica serovar Daytona]|uniref:5-methyltetrahydropteroyltriglutamate--homocysteine S-methyltransferase n=1 Tax=Salmonella enterica subsp. enterica serovar Daytona TaxID=1962639 RepID=A0A447JQW2_SALET|nr:5-methyltetrahydropteroyltriglutamate--homocysteine S-methyltransferase [Salmonella enterica subsp. enterica serovar Daytona]
MLELPQVWLDAFKPAYDALAGQVKLLLTTYFEGVTPNLDTIIALPVQGLHVDLIHGKDKCSGTASTSAGRLAAFPQA